MSTTRLCHIVRGLPGPRPLRRLRFQVSQQYCQYSTSGHMPKIAQPSLWQSMIPKFIRNRRAKAETSPAKSKEWNPASFYIIIFILIGSQAIRMIALKNEYNAYTRSTDAKIRLLREVIEKVQRGEKVDVEKLLGTGDEAKEREWEEVLREIEEEDSLWHRKNPSSESNHPVTPDPEQKQQVEKSRFKDPVVPAEGVSTQEPPKDGAARRRLNFF
ncbi:hypothetical protein KXW98_007909 [Aspergillus fumigatus]|nr:hypothetical protein CNMCM8714_007886 [Aspergillus fumigatus]KMK59610.1 hypothetical protein Y699_00811 [Aspergillus fumigatus Z5]KAF4272886.1 hypothetical protein CNMCM8812_008308 [Aspergillus fumigatus]KAH1279531.1 hypothetical protein KXX45_006840 [Aspergillus fumigatus]KAH1288658.1 hypothetical protein KXX30_007511 [Aspergillus fumigatus]